MSYIGYILFIVVLVVVGMRTNKKSRYYLSTPLPRKK